MTNFSDGSVFIIMLKSYLFHYFKKSQEKRTKPNEIFSDQTD